MTVATTKPMGHFRSYAYGMTVEKCDSRRGATSLGWSESPSIDTDVSRGPFTPATLASNVRKQLSEEKTDTFPWEWLLLVSLV